MWLHPLQGHKFLPGCLTTSKKPILPNVHHNPSWRQVVWCCNVGTTATQGSRLRDSRSSMGSLLACIRGKQASCHQGIQPSQIVASPHQHNFFIPWSIGPSWINKGTRRMTYISHPHDNNSTILGEQQQGIDGYQLTKTLERTAQDKWLCTIMERFNKVVQFLSSPNSQFRASNKTHNSTYQPCIDTY